MKIAIIGAGIYGCHIALSLAKEGYAIDLYDMADDIFSGASTHNSFRIHKGYHYPRSASTREMCKKDCSEFTKHYPHLLSPEEQNPKIFCIAKDDRTLMDYNTMKIIMDGSHLIYEELSEQALKSLGFTAIEGGFKVWEAVFLTDKAKSWFKKNLIESGVCIYLNSYIKNQDIVTADNTIIEVAGKCYDFVLNCTYNQGLQHYSENHDHFFDLCFSLVVASKEKHKNFCSFGIFDGDYPSLEPFGYEVVPKKYRQLGYERHQLFQIFHVKHTSIERFKDIEAARHAMTVGLTNKEINDLTEKIINDVLKFYPAFNEQFNIIDFDLALKTKVTNLSDCRPLIVMQDFARHKRLIQVFSSKLTTIFSAEKQLKFLINAELAYLQESPKIGKRQINSVITQEPTSRLTSQFKSPFFSSRSPHRHIMHAQEKALPNGLSYISGPMESDLFTAVADSLNNSVSDEPSYTPSILRSQLQAYLRKNPAEARCYFLAMKPKQACLLDIETCIAQLSDTSLLRGDLLLLNSIMSMLKVPIFVIDQNGECRNPYAATDCPNENRYFIFYQESKQAFCGLTLNKNYEQALLANVFGFSNTNPANAQLTTPSHH